MVRCDPSGNVPISSPRYLSNGVMIAVVGIHHSAASSDASTIVETDDVSVRANPLVGVVVGVAVGDVVGATDVGHAVGACDVGMCVGLADGLAVGAAVGVLEGTTVGATDGAVDDGAAVGAIVLGAADDGGDVAGARVGAAVGAIVLGAADEGGDVAGARVGALRISQVAVIRSALIHFVTLWRLPPMVMPNNRKGISRKLTAVAMAMTLVVESGDPSTNVGIVSAAAATTYPTDTLALFWLKIRAASF
jgi:hypothetical protein